MTESCRLKVRVIPNARKTEFAGFREGDVLLRLNAPAIEGRANDAAVDFLAKIFSIRRSYVQLVSGEKSRHKVFEIIGLSAGDIERKLASDGR